MNTSTQHQYLERLRSAPKRALVGIVIMVISSALGMALMQRDQTMMTALQVSRAVAAGELISIADTRSVKVPAVLAAAQWATSSDLIKPQRLTRSVRPGQLLYQTDFGASLSGEVVFAAAVAAELIPQGVSTGSQVQLWSIGQLDDSESRLITSAAMIVGLLAGDGREPDRLSIRIPPQFLAEALQVAADERLRLVSVE